MVKALSLSLLENEVFELIVCLCFVSRFAFYPVDYKNYIGATAGSAGHIIDRKIESIRRSTRRNSFSDLNRNEAEIMSSF